MQQAKVTALGTCVPERIVDNHYFENFIETNNEWIISRTGIHTRRYTGENEFTSHLCVGAARNLSERSGIDLEDVDFIIVSTVSPDQQMPSVASQLQHMLGIRAAGAIDISAACAGFSYGLVLAQGLIAAGTHKKILVFGAETLSKVTNFDDRTSCILFGDGAGVMLVEAAEKGNILGVITGCQGESGKELYMAMPSERLDVNGQEMVRDGKIHQNGKAVFKWAVSTVSK